MCFPISNISLLKVVMKVQTVLVKMIQTIAKLSAQLHCKVNFIMQKLQYLAI